MKKRASKRPFSSSLPASPTGKKRPGQMIFPLELKAKPQLSFLFTLWCKVEFNHRAVAKQE